jgi:hypothetical protein
MLKWTMICGREKKKEGKKINEEQKRNKIKQKRSK